MSFAVINMAWINDLKNSLSFQGQGNPQHGSRPTASNATMTPVGQAGNTSTVSASSNSSASGPGPEGTYQWEIVGTAPTQIINVSYNHPFGTGDTWVTVSCPPGYVASGCGLPASQTLQLNTNCSSLQNHDNAYCQITVSQAAT